MCQGQTPFFSVLHKFNICVAYHVPVPPSQLEHMDVCCSHDGYRHVHMWKSLDVVEIVIVVPFATPPAGEVGTRGAKGK